MCGITIGYLHFNSRTSIKVSVTILAIYLGHVKPIEALMKLFEVTFLLVDYKRVRYSVFDLEQICDSAIYISLQSDLT